jgi:hypothetical protein
MIPNGGPLFLLKAWTRVVSGVRRGGHIRGSPARSGSRRALAPGIPTDFSNLVRARIGNAGARAALGSDLADAP